METRSERSVPMNPLEIQYIDILGTNGKKGTLYQANGFWYLEVGDKHFDLREKVGQPDSLCDKLAKEDGSDFVRGVCVVVTVNEFNHIFYQYSFVPESERFVAVFKIGCVEKEMEELG